MKQLMRFGRRVPLPSTAQILHDLRIAQREDDLKAHPKIVAAAPTKRAGRGLPHGGGVVSDD
jgi:hypothetical protein